MKKILAVTLFSLTLLGVHAFGEQKTVECSTNQAFSENTCDVCYEDTATSATNILEIKDIKIPWKNTQAVSEVIYNDEAAEPEMISSFPISITPTKADDAWKITNAWTGDPEEFVLAA